MCGRKGISQLRVVRRANVSRLLGIITMHHVAKAPARNNEQADLPSEGATPNKAVDCLHPMGVECLHAKERALSESHRAVAGDSGPFDPPDPAMGRAAWL